MPPRLHNRAFPAGVKDPTRLARTGFIGGRAIPGQKRGEQIMPYKDPERKRQWEREHREQRNARRRIPHLGVTAEPSSVEVSLPDPISGQEREPGVNMVVFLAMGFTFLMLTLFAGWLRIRFGRRCPSKFA